MAQQPKTDHPIRELRRAIGKLQGEFARTIGISADYLKKIENRTRPLRPEIARRIQVEAGINPRQLMKGRLRSVFDEKYTSAHYKQWKGRFTKQNELIAQKETDKLMPWIEILLRAAANKNRLYQATDLLIESVNECRKSLKLGPGIDGILARKVKLRKVKLPDDELWVRPTLGWHPEGHGSTLDRLWWWRRSLRRYRAWRHNHRVATIRRKRRSSRAPARA